MPPDDPHVLRSDAPTLSYSSTPPAELVPLATYTNATEANLARAKLEAAGIRSFVGGELTASVLGWYGAGFAKHDLLVNESDATEAVRILEEVAAARELTRRREGGTPVACPACRSSVVRRSKTRGWITIVLLCACITLGRLTYNAWWLLLAIPAAYFFATLDKAKWKCQTCGHEWKHRVVGDEPDEVGADVGADPNDEPRVP